jgi:hypothetical protein
MHKAAFLYLADDDGPLYKIETDPGLRCILEDISDTGCAVTVGGKSDSGMKVKVQFALNNAPTCMSGTIRSTSYHEDTGRSLLHIEADPLPLETRNRILGEVFGMQSDEDDEELPFRVLEGEASGAGNVYGVPANARSLDDQRNTASESDMDIFDSPMMDADDV